MKTEEHPEPTAVFLQRVTAAVSELRDQLQQDYERKYPGLVEIIRIVVDEEEAKAWELSFFPHLFLPDMVEAHIATLGREHADTKRDKIVAPSVFAPLKLAEACERQTNTNFGTQ
jgi:hypothetical protein